MSEPGVMHPVIAPVPGPSVALPAAWRLAVQSALALVLPTWCAGCGAPDVGLCGACRGALEACPVRRHDVGVPVCAGLTFDGVAARVLRACKEEARTGVTRVLAPALAVAASAVLAAASPGPVLVVPVPTTAAAMRRRGFRPVELLAARAGLAPQRMLTARGRPADQRGLRAAERARNVGGTMRVPRWRAGAVAGRRVLLVDDVVTTGSTLREAVRALETAGATVIGAAAVASTPRRTGESPLRPLGTSFDPARRT